MSIRKASLQEFQHQIKDIKSQLVDQIKCLEQRTDVQVNILHEVNDFLKKRAEIDSEYSKQLDKLVKSVMLKHKNEKQKRSSWSLYSTCCLWQQLVDDTKDEAKQRGITAEVYGNYITSSIATRCVALQKISKKCREIGVQAQGEVIRVIDELFAAMKTYQLCFTEHNVVNAKLQHAEAEKSKAEQESSSARKQRSMKKNFDKKSAKFEASRLKCNRARNEYLLSIEAANASLHKFFADDLADLIDCTDLGIEYWLNLILTNIISVRKAACQTEMNSLANLSTFKESLQPQLDKQKFFESNSSVFMLPKRFEFKCDTSEQINTIALDEGLSEELRQRHYQMCKRLERLRLESDEGWQKLEQTEQRVRDLLSTSTLLEITKHGIADNRPPEDSTEAELAKAVEYYLPTFRFYLLNANLIVRLEARADGIGNALVKANYPLTVIPNENVDDSFGGGAALSFSQDQRTADDLIGTASDSDWHEKARRKKRLGSQASATTAESVASASNAALAAASTGGNGGAQFSPLRRRRPRLFGGSLEEYVEWTGEKIPLVVTSCIRVLSQFALHHQGVFRVSGSQVEINHMKEAFENGDDPLCNIQNANDANSIAGVLKLYFRELREPLFPFYLFELITDCAKCTNTADFINEISSLLCKLPRPTYLLLRYLFAFLNHLSEFSDENMMDHYNLAICFGPTLLPIPEGKDQVYYQTFVNEVVKNLIVHHDLIFTARVVGPRYEKYDATGGKSVDLYVDDLTDEYFGSAGTNASLSNTTAGGSSSAVDEEGGGGETNFDYRRYANDILLKERLDEKLTTEPSGGAMNASTISMGSLGFSQYSECLPPSITATLLKPTNNGKALIETSNAPAAVQHHSNDSTADSNGKNGQEACVVEESDLDTFLKYQLQIDAPTSSPQGDYSRGAPLLTQSLRQKMKHFQPTADGVTLKEVTQPNVFPLHKLSADNSSVSSIKYGGTTTSPALSDRRPSLRDSSKSRSSQHSRGSSDGNDGIKPRSQSRKRDAQQLPPTSPQSQDSILTADGVVQYSQIMANMSRSERIRIPVVPDGNATSNAAGGIASNFSLNRQRSHDSSQSNAAYYQRVNKYGKADVAIPPSYNTLYGNGSTSYRTLPGGSFAGNKDGIDNNDKSHTRNVSGINGGDVVFRNTNNNHAMNGSSTTANGIRSGTGSPIKQISLGISAAANLSSRKQFTKDSSKDQSNAAASSAMP